MKQVKLQVDDVLYRFYQNVGKQAGGRSAEQVMADALFKLAGELSLNALAKKEKPSGNEK